MKKNKVSQNKVAKSMGSFDMRSLCKLILEWKPHYILNYTPLYILNRTKLFFYEINYPGHPWLTRQANAFLSTLLKPTDCGLEWGSGRSTIWFAKRIKYLTSVEHNEDWYKRVMEQIKSNNILNVKYFHCKIEQDMKNPNESSYCQVVNNFGKASLDFVLLDGIYRDLCANMVLEKIRPGGIIVLDNANWYLPCDSISPNSRPKNSTPASEEWVHFLNRVRGWRLIWTTDGVTDTAIWFKP